MLNRRGLLTGLGASLVVAPAIVRPMSIMPIKVMGDYSLTIAPFGVGPVMTWIKEWNNLSLLMAEMLRDRYLARRDPATVNVSTHIRGGGMIRHMITLPEFTEIWDENLRVQSIFAKGLDGKIDVVDVARMERVDDRWNVTHYDQTA